MKGGFPVAISMTVQPSDQTSAGGPYPLNPLSITSGAMYCNVPANTSRLWIAYRFDRHDIANSIFLEKIHFLYRWVYKK